MLRIPLARDAIKSEPLVALAILALIDATILVIGGAIRMDLAAFFVTFAVATIIGVLLGIYLMSLFLHAVDQCADAKAQKMMQGTYYERTKGP